MTAPGQYNAIFDGNGVPVWWFRDPLKPAAADIKYLPDGTLAWPTGPAGPDLRYEIRSLEGELLNTLRTVDTDLDSHDLRLLPSGNYMLMSYRERGETTDLTRLRRAGGRKGLGRRAPGSHAGRRTGLVVEQQGQNRPEETGHWWDDLILPIGGGVYNDVVHINSVDVRGDTVVVSMRHTDGVYGIDRASGEITWKLVAPPRRRASP